LLLNSRHIFAKEVYPVKYREDFNSKKAPYINQRCSYVLCVRYGSEGYIPTIIRDSRNSIACMSSSGGSVCGGYCGVENVNGTDFYVVRCMNHMECMQYEG